MKTWTKRIGSLVLVGMFVLLSGHMALPVLAEYAEDGEGLIALPAKQEPCAQETAPQASAEETPAPEPDGQPATPQAQTSGDSSLGEPAVIQEENEQPVANPQATSYSVQVDGQVDYGYAWQVLDLVNEERAADGKAALQMNKTIMEVAMLRAAEQSLLYSHTRPDGTSCFTVWSSQFSRGENIAYGQPSPQAVVDAWMNSDGHRRNILNEDYASIGVGCFVRNNTLYWVQLFDGVDTRAPASRQGGRTSKTYTINSLADHLALTIDGQKEVTYTLALGERYDLMAQLQPGLAAASYSITSSNSGVVAVEGGTLVAKAGGDAVVTVSLKALPAQRATLTLRVPKEGWYTENGQKYYYQNDRPFVGKQMIEDKTYYFSDTGAMQTGWITDGVNKYYADTNGVLATGWQTIDDNRHYFSSSGIMATGWRDIDGHRRYFSDSGIMATGWQTINGYSYYFDSSGVMATGWVTDSAGWWYYLGANGQISKNAWVQDGSEWYYMSGNGRITKNAWALDGSEWYYMGGNGRITKNVWAQDSGGWYYLGANGRITRNAWAQDSNGWYYMGGNGRMLKNQWLEDNGNLYYFTSNGLMATGTVLIDGYYHIFNADGVWQSVA